MTLTWPVKRSEPMDGRSFLAYEWAEARQGKEKPSPNCLGAQNFIPPLTKATRDPVRF